MLRPFQKEALQALASPRIHLRLTSPTGSGKGVVVEELARDPDERIVLLTPLVALARQQARRLRARGVPLHVSLALGNAPDPGPTRDQRVWILSPEGALGPRKTERIRAWRPTLVAIDEAHCIEEWGGSFRPAYGRIAEWVRELGCKRTLWMSATFPAGLAAALERSVPGEWSTVGRFALPSNLSLSIERVAYGERIERVRAEVVAARNPGVLFAATRKTAEDYSRMLSLSGARFLPYHAGLSDEERRAIEQALERGRLEGATGPRSPSVCATSAFGMGMDFPQFEWALVTHAPVSILSLMQAVGRVGRSNAGKATVLWAEEDFRIAGYLVSRTSARKPGEERLAGLRRYLESREEDRGAILSGLFL
jgi:ATP-dependent DNA helicase RecQ